MAYDDLDDGFGWNGMGEPVAGGPWHPAWGALAGGSVGSGTAIAVRQLATSVKWKKWSEGVGLLAAGVTGGAALMYGPTRAAGWTTIAAAFGGGFPRLLEDLLINYAEGAAAGTEGVGMPSIQRVGRAVGVAGRGTGMPVLERTRQAGLLGQSGERARLLGAGQDRQKQLRLVGGPALNSMGNHFGNSIVGARAA